MTDDEELMDPALVPEQRPSEAAMEPPNPQVMFQQFQQLLKMYVDQGMIHQRPDGTLVMPGTVAQKRRTQGSACFCSQCTEHNQRHWVCVVCGSVHEYVIERPTNSWPHLGPAGVAGRLDAVCTDACAREYLQGQRQQHIQQQGLPNVPMNGSDESLGLLLTQGLGS